jgi:putative tryptophan/tyrosine transport system substrate-binding protein
LWFSLKRLAFGLVLIALTSSALLLSDLGQRKQNARQMPRIAVLQHASQPLLDEAVEGMIQGLREGGFRIGESISLTRYNAENDLPTDNAIAKEITDGKFEMVLTSSTLSMQTVANANRAGKTIHVFGAVADPYVRASDWIVTIRKYIPGTLSASARSCLSWAASNWLARCFPV